MVRKQTVALVLALLFIFTGIPAFAAHKDYHGGWRSGHPGGARGEYTAGEGGRNRFL